jgi:hypothetical protein
MTLDPTKIDLPLTALVISLLALLISGANALNSFYVARRDQARLKITCAFNEANIWVTIVNAGRRPIILRKIGHTMHTGDVEMYGPLGEGRDGERLDEHESYEHTVGVLDSPEHDEDTLYARFMSGLSAAHANEGGTLHNPLGQVSSAQQTISGWTTTAKRTRSVIWATEG